MAAAIALIVVGFTLVYSALKGLSLTDVLSGATGNRLDPKGGTAARRGKVTGPAAADAAAGADPSGTYEGPAAKVLKQLDEDAQNKFNLTITDRRRSRARACANGNCGSKHVTGEAFDAASNNKADMIAFAKYAHEKYPGVIRVLHTPAGFPWPDHDDHVHVQSS